jgi:hypothetical protein
MFSRRSKEKADDKSAQDKSFIATVIQTSHSRLIFGGAGEVINIVLELENGELRYAALPGGNTELKVLDRVRVSLGEMYAFQHTGEYIRKTDQTVQHSGTPVRWLLIESYKILQEQEGL